MKALALTGNWLLSPSWQMTPTQGVPVLQKNPNPFRPRRKTEGWGVLRLQPLALALIDRSA
jgi:hypothetical protein